MCWEMIVALVRTDFIGISTYHICQVYTNQHFWIAMVDTSVKRLNPLEAFISFLEFFLPTSNARRAINVEAFVVSQCCVRASFRNTVDDVNFKRSLVIDVILRRNCSASVLCSELRKKRVGKNMRNET